MLIKHRIYLILFLVTLLPLILLSVLSDRVSEDAIKKVIIQDFQVLAKEEANAIGRYLDERINETRLLSLHPAIINTLRRANATYQNQSNDVVMAAIHTIDTPWIASKGKTSEALAILDSKLSNMLRALQERRPDIYGEIFVTDRLGATVAMTKTLSDYYQADEYWWHEASKFIGDGAFLDDRGYDESVQANVIGVVVPVVVNNEVLGIFKINFRVKAIIDIVSDEIRTPGHSLTLARSDGSIITSSKSTHPTTLTARQIETINLPKTFLWEGEVEGKKIISAHYPMKHSFRTRATKGAIMGVAGESTQVKTWFVIHEIDQDHAFAPLVELRNTQLTLGASAIVLAIIFGFILSRDIARPLTVLRRGTKVIGEGDLSHRIVLKQHNEFGSMAKSFNNMTKQLQETLATRDELNREVAERRQVQKEMSLLKDYLNDVLDSMPSIVVGIDINGKVTHWNRVASASTGIELEQARSRPVWELLPILQAKKDEILNAVQKGEAFIASHMADQAKGNHRYSELLVYPLSATDIEGAVIRLDDVTERTLMEERMVQAEKMLSVGGLAGGMAHELNNPLGGMVQSVQNIRRRLSSDVTKNIEAASRHNIDLERLKLYMEERKVNELFDTVASAGQRASDIINNMLRFVRKSEYAFQRINIEDLIHQTVALASVDYDLKKKYDFRSIEITQTFDPNLPAVDCIPGELQQVILNLLRNAAQALGEQSDTRQITLSTQQIDDQCQITVSDNGPGMDKETIKRAFEPFFSTKPPGQGSGLGLSVSYYIIHDEHGGDITVESIPGKGSHFHISFPIERKEMS